MDATAVQAGLFDIATEYRAAPGAELTDLRGGLWIVGPSGEYRYAARNSGYSSARFGECECCGRTATEVWSQREQRAYGDPTAERLEDGGWTHHETRHLYGHEDCLLQARR